MEEINWFKYDSKQDNLRIMNITQSVISIKKCYLEEVNKHFLRGSKILLGCKNGILYLKFGQKQGQTFANRGNVININHQSNILSNWIKENNILRGSYSIEYIGDLTYKCEFLK